MDKRALQGVLGTLLWILVTYLLGDINVALACVATVVTVFVLSLIVPVQFGSRAYTVALAMTITIPLVLLFYYATRPPFPLSVKMRNAIIATGFPGPFFYGYDDGGDKFVAPIGYMTQIWVTNQHVDGLSEGLRDYSVDVLTGSKWHRLNPIQIRDPHQFYRCSSARKCKRLILDILDHNIAGKKIERGETVSGWIFFQWPPELRSKPEFEQARINVTTVTGEGDTIPIKFSEIDPKSVELSVGATSLSTEYGFVDLCGVRVRTMSDCQDYGVISCE